MTSFEELHRALTERKREWDDKAGVELPLSYHANELAGEVGEACNIVKKLERAAYGLTGSRATIADLRDELADAAICLAKLSHRCGINLGDAVRTKFNATSIKLGLAARMRFEETITPVPTYSGEDLDGQAYRSRGD